MKKLMISFMALSMMAPAVMAQDYEMTSVWEHLWTDESAEYPWLRAESGTNWEHTGNNEMDFFSTLIRYDEERCMLLLVENGVDEENATAEELELSATFPDRSILWIDADTGAFLGVAIDLALQPAPDSEYYIQKTTGTHPDGPTSDRSFALTEQWPHMGVDGDGYVYVGDKHKLLRYMPDGSGGFSGPEVVFTYPEMDPPIFSVNPDNLHYRAWRMYSINVKGSGDNKVMTTAARFWIDGGGIVYYTSNDGGASWEIDQHKGQEQRNGIGHGGATSAPVEANEEEWVFGNGFPGSDDRIYRFFRNAGTTEEFIQDIPELWDPQIDPADVPEVDKYMKWNVIDVAAADGVPYIAALTLPRWQSRNDPELETATAWVGLHSISLDPNGDGVEGDFLSSYQINVNEGDEGQGVAGDEDNWDAAYFATINMSKPEGFTDGTAEIFWSGGNFGFGRIVVGDVDLPANVKDWSLF